MSGSRPSPFIWPNGQYAAAVERLRANLNRDQLKISFLEHVQRDTRNWLRDTEDFLGVRHFEFSDEVLGRRVNESPPMKMPPFFRELFSDYAEEELGKLADLGLTLNP